jgi:REP element-mobilizing transposase RayT
MVLNQFGMVAQNEWYKLPDRFPNLRLDAFQVMPNHIHGIIILNEPCAGATLVVAPLNYNNAVSPIHDEQTVSPIHDEQTVSPIHDEHTVSPIHDEHTVSPIHDEQTVSPIHDEQTVSPHDNQGAGASPAPATSSSNPTVGNIIGAYKSLVATEILKIFITNNEKMGKLWQRNYYERIIRNQKSYYIISKYIKNNPAKWNI